MLFSITREEVKPNGAWEHNGDPIQGTEKKALYRVSIFVDAETVAFVRIMNAEENKDAQRQASAIPRQIGNNAVAEAFTAGVPAAAEKPKQTGKVDRQTPGELQEIEQDSGPAGGGNCPARKVFCLVHVKEPLLILH